MNKLNEWIAVKITIVVGTMWAFYILMLYGFTPIIWPQYISQIMYWSNFLQLIFLPILAVGSTVLSRMSDKRSQETHDAVMEELSDLKELMQYIREKS